MVFGLSQLKTRASSVEWHSVEIDGTDYPVRILRRHNARRITIRVRDNTIHITIPSHSSVAEAHRFLASQHAWINHQIKARKQALAEALPEGKIYYLGALMTVQINHTPDHLGRSVVEVGTDSLTITINAASRARPDRILTHWLKAQAQTAIAQELAHTLPRLNHPPTPFSLRDQKTRWGSCSTTGRLSFNWRLIMAPPETLRYVVIHEAAHLIHHNHSPDFWALVERLMPDYRHHSAWLKDNNVALMADIGLYLTASQ